jgi:hypothetical protein
MSENATAPPPPATAAAAAAASVDATNDDVVSGDVCMSALFAQVNKGLAFLEGKSPKAWRGGLLFAKFPRTLSAARWGTCVTDGRAEVVPDKLEEIKRVFAQEVAIIMMRATDIDIDVTKDLRAECVRWINKRLVETDAELDELDVGFAERKTKLRAEVCEEAYGQVDATRTARISVLQREMQAIYSDKSEIRDEREELVYARCAFQALASSVWVEPSAEDLAEAAAEPPAKRARCD